MLLSTLEVKLGISGDAAVVSGLKKVQQAEQAAAGGADGLTNAMNAMEIPALRAMAAAQGLGMALIALGAGAIALSGIKLAAQYEKLNIGFTTLLGSARAARSLMSDLQAMGERTDFQTKELVGFARGLLATDNSANKALNTLKTLKAVTDAMAATGGTTADVGQAASTLGQMRIATRIDMEQIKVLSHLGINIPDVYKAATGQTVAPQIAMSRLASMRGQAAFDLIIKGMEKLYKGAAAAQAGTALGLLQNIIETLGNVALPTGALLLTVVKPLAEIALRFISTAKSINLMTNGVAGLIVILALIVRTWGFLSGVAVAAYTATRQLTAALMEYSAAARMAAGATTAGAAAAGGGAAAAAAGGGAAAAAAGGGAAAATGLRSIWPRLVGGGLKAALPEIGLLIKGFFGGIGRLMMGALGVGLVALATEMIGNWMKGSGNKDVRGAGGVMANVGSFAGWGALIGGILGSVIPGLGTAVGALVGAIIGGIGGAFKSWWDSTHQASRPPATDTTAQQTLQVLKDIHAQMIGGGEHGNRVKSELEAEYSLRAAIFAGAG